MGREEQIISERMRKLEELRKQGVNPYPPKFEVKDTTSDLQRKFSKIRKEEKTKSNAVIAGRLMTLRDLGKIVFAVLNDGCGKIQIILQEKETPEKIREFFKKFIDTGDFIGVEGVIIKTKTGELSVLVKNLTLLTKSILPLPEKWYGLKDNEERLRKRYLDILMNQEVKEMFIRKSKFWNTIRSFLIDKGFIEVETPVLENEAGGATATPFKTHLDALDLDVYLRISMGELWQKKLMVAGFPKTFEIGRQFRNEGIDAEHLQDYTQMEMYWAYQDYEGLMKFLEKMLKKVIKETVGELQTNCNGEKINWGGKWPKSDYYKLFKEASGINLKKTSEDELLKKAIELKVESAEKKLGRGRLIDLIYKKTVRPKLIQPAFLVNPPAEVEPLAKRWRKDETRVERFQIVACGTELGKGFSELNDPIDQRTRFEEQKRLRVAGDKEAQMFDEDYLEAMEHGMPPTAGFGISERFFAILMNKSVRECVFFPLMRKK